MEVESPKRDSLCGDGLATYSPAAAQLSLVFRVLGFGLGLIHAPENREIHHSIP
jgi:hypothetical protein